MVKIKHKKAFKASLRDAKGPDLKNPYVSPAVPAKGSLARAEDVCKELAAHDVKIRDMALAETGGMLRAFELAEKKSDIPLEFAKLWHGLFYCMWHSDKPLVQLDCAERIAQLVLSLKSWEMRAVWLGCGWACLHKHWGMLDKWRINKYYSLMRFLFSKVLTSIAEAEEVLGDCDAADVMVHAFCKPLLDTYTGGLSGVGSHITDILIEECVEAKLPAETFTSIFMQLLLPVLTSGDSFQCEHIYDYVWKKLIGGFQESDETVDWLAEIPFDVLSDTLKAAAVDEDTQDKNRDLLTRIIEEMDEFLGQADDFDEEVMEVDSDEEIAEVRHEARRKIEIEGRNQADTAANRRRDVRERRTAEKKIKKASSAGDTKAVKELLKVAKKKGVKVKGVGAKKKKQGKGKLTAQVSKDGTELVKVAKKRHRKRRV